MFESTDYTILMFGSIGFQELFVVFLIVLLLFGAKRLPEIARSLGRAIQEFKKTKDDIMSYDETEDASKPSQSTEPKEEDSKKASAEDTKEDIDPKSID